MDSGLVTGAPTSTTSAISFRRRAPTACRVCRQRKVKCNVATAGIPCVNCVRDGRYCEVFGRKKRSHPQAKVKDLNTCPSNTDTRTLPTTPLCAIPFALARPQPLLLGPSTSSCTVTSATSNITTQSAQTCSSANTPSTVSCGTKRDVDREATVESDSEASSGQSLEDHAIESLTTSLMGENAGFAAETFYVGDQQGIGYILDIVGESNGLTQHYGLPLFNRTSHDALPQDMAYLKSKGVFSIPSEAVCQALFRAYFYHVHPVLPVVDSAAVLSTFRNNGASAISLLLLWSMFSVATNYVDKGIVRMAGFQTHKEMKRCMFTRAKCFYDNGHEKDRITIIQSVSLLAFWYSELRERTESWHWMGIAIGLAQTLGLNRDPDRGQYNMRLTDRQRQLWRRIWWSCYIRDRWLSLAMGRPMRINSRDCDTPEPSATDLLDDFSELPPTLRNKFVPPDFEQLMHQWSAFLRLSKVLGNILSENYCLSGPVPSKNWIEATERELMHCMTLGPHEVGYGQQRNASSASPALAFQRYQLQLHFNAATIALWRPYSHSAATDVRPDQESAWHYLVQQKIRIAAANTNVTLDKVISEQLIGYIGPMTIPTLVPAMNSHLLESKSADPLIKQSSLHKLNLPMMVLESVQEVYSSATFIHGLFSKVIEKMKATQPSITTYPPQQQQQQHHHVNHNNICSSRQNNAMIGITNQHINSHNPPGSYVRQAGEELWRCDEQMSEFWELLAPSTGTSSDDSLVP